MIATETTEYTEGKYTKYSMKHSCSLWQKRISKEEKMRDELTEAIIGAAIEVHKHLGPGLLESIYEEMIATERKRTNTMLCALGVLGGKNILYIQQEKIIIDTD